MTEDELHLHLALAVLNAAATTMAPYPDMKPEQAIKIAMETFYLAWAATEKHVTEAKGEKGPE